MELKRCNAAGPRPGALGHRPLRQSDLDDVTLCILSVLASGATLSRAAVDCSVSESTLRRRLSAARDAWGVETNTQLVVNAVRRGLI